MNTPPGTPEARGRNITNIHNLKNVLRGLNTKWVLSGSQAMKLHANRFGVHSRTPHNFDIVVNRNNVRNFLHAFAAAGYKPNVPVMTRTTNKVTVKRGNSSVNVLVAGALGPKITNESTMKINNLSLIHI